MRSRLVLRRSEEGDEVDEGDEGDEGVSKNISTLLMWFSPVTS